MNSQLILSLALKRPLRRFRRFCRVMGGRDVWSTREARLRTARLGSEYGGWTIWPETLDERSVVYSFGAGQDVSFDLAMILRFGCAVHVFDPTPRSVEWVRRQRLPEKFHFHEYGVGSVDGLVSFEQPADPTHVSYSLLDGAAGTRKTQSFPVRRLTTIAAELGHHEIDLVKMDIEGAEYGVLEDLVEHGPRVKQLLVEFHHRQKREMVRQTREAIRRLREAGYLIFDVAPSGEEYSFVRQDALTASHAIVPPAISEIPEYRP